MYDVNKDKLAYNDIKKLIQRNNEELDKASMRICETII